MAAKAARRLMTNSSDSQIISQAVSAMLPCSSAIIDQQQAVQDVAPAEEFSMMILAGVPPLFTPGTQLQSTDDQDVTMTLVDFDPLSGSCVVFCEHDVFSKPRAALETMEPLESIETTLQLMPNDHLLNRIYDSLTAACAHTDHSQHVKRVAWHLKTLHSYIADSSDTQRTLQVIRRPTFISKLFQLAQLSTGQPGDLMLEELECLMLYGGSTDMAQEMDRFMKPRVYVNCSKKYSLRVRAEPNLDALVLGLVHRNQSVVVVGHEGEWCRLKLIAEWKRNSDRRDLQYGWARRVATDRDNVRHVMLEPKAVTSHSFSTGDAPSTNTPPANRKALRSDAIAQDVAEFLSAQPGRNRRIIDDEASAVFGASARLDADSASNQTRQPRLGLLTRRQGRRHSLPVQVPLEANALFARQTDDILIQNDWDTRLDSGPADVSGEINFSHHNSGNRYNPTAQHSRISRNPSDSASDMLLPQSRFTTRGSAGGSHNGLRAVASRHPVAVGEVIPGSITVPGASRLRLTFDLRCSTHNTHSTGHERGMSPANGRSGTRSLSPGLLQIPPGLLQVATADNPEDGPAVVSLPHVETQDAFQRACANQKADVATTLLAPDDATRLADTEWARLNAGHFDGDYHGCQMANPCPLSTEYCKQFHSLEATGTKLILGTRDDPLTHIHQGAEAWAPVIIEGDTVQYAFCSSTLERNQNPELGFADGETWGFSFTITVEAGDDCSMFDEGLQPLSKLGSNPLQYKSATRGTLEVPKPRMVRKRPTPIAIPVGIPEDSLSESEAGSGDDTGASGAGIAVDAEGGGDTEQADVNSAVPSSEVKFSPRKRMTGRKRYEARGRGHPNLAHPNLAHSNKSTKRPDFRDVDAPFLTWPLAEVLAGLDKHNISSAPGAFNGKDAQENSVGPRDRSCGVLQAILDRPGEIGSTSGAEIVRATAILRARSILLDLLVEWPDDEPLTDDHCNGDASLLFSLFHNMHERVLRKSILRQGMQSVVQHGTRSLLDQLIKYAPLCIHQAKTLTIQKNGPLSYLHNRKVFRDQVYVRGATSLRITFDPKTIKAFHCDTLILASSFDLQSQRTVLKYNQTPTTPLVIKGNRLYIKYDGRDGAGDEQWPWKFSVDGDSLGLSEIGFGFLSTFIDVISSELPSVAVSASLGEDSSESESEHDTTAVEHVVRAPRLKRLDSIDSLDRFDRTLLAAAQSSNRTTALWRANAVDTLWQALTAMAVHLKGWPLLECTALLCNVVELSTSDSPIDLRRVQPLWQLNRRVYVEDSSARTIAGSMFLRTFSRFFFAVEDKAQGLQQMSSIFMATDHHEYDSTSYTGNWGSTIGPVPPTLHSGAIEAASTDDDDHSFFDHFEERVLSDAQVRKPGL